MCIWQWLSMASAVWIRSTITYYGSLWYLLDFNCKLVNLYHEYSRVNFKQKLSLCFCGHFDTAVLMNILRQTMELHSTLQPNLTDNSPMKSNTTLDMATILYLSTACVIFVVGSLGNIAVIGAVTVYHKLRLMANVFIVNLAIADLLITGVVSPLAIIGILTNGSIFRTSRVLCEIFVVICTISCTTSVNSITLVAVNRYICICHGRLYTKVFNKKTITFILASLWLSSCSSRIPTVMDSYYETRSLHCTFDTSRLFSGIAFAVGISISCIITTYCYIKILFYFAKTKRALKRYSQNDESQHAIPLTDVRLLRSVIIVMLVFILGWFPFLLTQIIDGSGPETKYHIFSREWYLFVSALTHISSCTNSFIYANTNATFREGYIVFLKRCWSFTTKMTMNKH